MIALTAFAGGQAPWWYATVSQLLAFGLLVFIVAKYLVPVIRKFVDDRSKSIQDEFDKLERETRDVSAQVATLKQRLADVGAESTQRIQAALDEGARMRDQAVADANAQAAAELDKARRDIAIERDKAVLELRAEVARLTFGVTEQAVDGLVNEQMHGKMADKYVGGLEQASPHGR